MAERAGVSAVGADPGHWVGRQPTGSGNRGQCALEVAQGRGASARVEVNFDTEGSKWLVLQYANLQLM